MPLLEISAKCVVIDGNPYQKGSLRATYTGDNITVRENNNNGRSIINNIPYGDIVNPDTALAFATLDELKSFVLDNFFFDISGSVIADVSGLAKVFKKGIVAAGNTFSIPGWDAPATRAIWMFHNETNRKAPNWDQGTLTIDGSAFGGFEPGDQVVVIGQII